MLIEINVLIDNNSKDINICGIDWSCNFLKTNGFNLRQDEFLGIDIEDNYIKLIPVDIEPRWTKKELKKIDRIVKKEKGKSKMLKPGKRFSKYIKKIKK